MPDTLRIRWAPPLPSGKLVRLYESNAIGLIDDEVLDDVGWRLWERLSDVGRVVRGEVRCPGCGVIFQVRSAGRDVDDVVSCPSGDWSVTPRDWHRSWENRDLNGHCPEFQHFVNLWPTASSPRDRMVLVDAIVHALHVSARHDLPGNFAARNFIEGSRPKVVALLDELAKGPGSQVAEGVRARWEVARSRYRERYNR